mmetsp:Transcript_52358/g.135108  ORF Transcript_52358/g.135108 Transcript_52358/m.135108 type:complete len:202 (-) Transcript_52358:2163-2768(-)
MSAANAASDAQPPTRVASATTATEEVLRALPRFSLFGSESLMVMYLMPAIGWMHEQPMFFQDMSGHSEQPRDIGSTPHGSTSGHALQSAGMMAPGNFAGAPSPLGSGGSSELRIMTLWMRPVSSCVRKWQWKTNLPSKITAFPPFALGAPATKHCLSRRQPQGGTKAVSRHSPYWKRKSGSPTLPFRIFCTAGMHEITPGK